MVEFRASWAIRFAVLFALVVWLAVGVAATLTGAVSPSALLSIGFFVAFFGLFVRYYWCMAYVVDEYGVTYRGATDFAHFPWEDIEDVSSSEIPLGGYYVTAKGGGFLLSDFVGDRKELLGLIVARAGLFPT